MKRSKTAFGYELKTETCTIKVLTQVLNEYKTSSYVVECNDGRKLFPRSLKSAQTIVQDFNEYYKIYNRNKS